MHYRPRNPANPTSPGHTNNDTIINKTRAETRRYLSSKTSHYSILLLVSLDVASIFADFLIQILRCEGKIPDDNAEHTINALGIVSLVFSCLFMVELLASIWAFGFGYFRSKFHCFDAFVIVLGFFVDVLLKGVLEEAASLVVVLRLWRVFKIIEELSVGAEEQMEGLQERMEDLEKENGEMKHELASLKARVEVEESLV